MGPHPHQPRTLGSARILVPLPVAEPRQPEQPQEPLGGRIQQEGVSRSLLHVVIFNNGVGGIGEEGIVECKVRS
jgi:hypothetical protein